MLQESLHPMNLLGVHLNLCGVFVAWIWAGREFLDILGMSADVEYACSRLRRIKAGSLETFWIVLELQRHLDSVGRSVTTCSRWCFLFCQSGWLLHGVLNLSKLWRGPNNQSRERDQLDFSIDMRHVSCQSETGEREQLIFRKTELLQLELEIEEFG